jgi:hypothetical protein
LELPKADCPGHALADQRLWIVCQPVQDSWIDLLEIVGHEQDRPPTYLRVIEEHVLTGSNCTS